MNWEYYRPPFLDNPNKFTEYEGFYVFPLMFKDDETNPVYTTFTISKETQLIPLKVVEEKLREIDTKLQTFLGNTNRG